MIVLRSPKGWTGPKEVDGLKTEGSWRSHQVPFTMEKPEHLGLLEQWMRSYHLDVLFTPDGAPRPDIAALAPIGARRMSANVHANGGVLARPLRMPDFRAYAAAVASPSRDMGEATRVLGTFLRDVMRENSHARNFRVFGPDETASNRLQALFEVTDRAWDAEMVPGDDHLAPDAV